MGQLGLQRIAAGGSAMLELLRRGSSSKDGASDNFGLLSQRWKLRACVVQRVAVDRQARFSCLMKMLEIGQHYPSSRRQYNTRIRDLEY